MTETDISIHLEPGFFASVVNGRTYHGPYCRLVIQDREGGYSGVRIFTDAAGLAKIRDAISQHLATVEAELEAATAN